MDKNGAVSQQNRLGTRTPDKNKHYVLFHIIDYILNTRLHGKDVDWSPGQACLITLACSLGLLDLFSTPRCVLANQCECLLIFHPVGYNETCTKGDKQSPLCAGMTTPHAPRSTGKSFYKLKSLKGKGPGRGVPNLVGSLSLEQKRSKTLVRHRIFYKQTQQF